MKNNTKQDNRIIIVGGMGPQGSLELHSRILRGSGYLWRI